MTDTNKKFKRSSVIDFTRDNKVEDASRRVHLAFASEAPVERWGENEILSHDEGEYDFSRINDGSHPLLLGHEEWNPDSQIGVVESAQVDKDKISRAVVRFGNSAKASEIYQDVKDGIRKLVSVGYERTGIVSSDKDKKSGMVTTRYKWMPTHIAIVPVPADTAAGIGRAVDFSLKVTTALPPQQNKQNMPELTTPGGGAAVEETQAIRNRITQDETKRIREITSLADSYREKHGSKNAGALAGKINELAKDAIASGQEVRDFKSAALAEIAEASPVKPITMENVSSPRDWSKYNLMRGIRSAILARESGNPGLPTDGMELEVHQEMCKQARSGGGGELPGSGFKVPEDAPTRISRRDYARRVGRRDMQATVYPQGGAAVPTLMMVPIIELLRNLEVLPRVGVRQLGGLTGNVVIPRQTAASTAYAVSEIGALTPTQMALDQVPINPHRVGWTGNYSKQLLLQSSPDIESIIRDDAFKVLALLWDYYGIAGSGANSQPMGVLNTPGIGSITLGGTPTYIKMIAMETALRTANVAGELAYVTTPSSKGDMKGVAEALTGATTIGGSANALWKSSVDWEMGMVNGYDAIDSNQVPNNLIVLGEWTDLIKATWGGLDVVVDYLTLASNAEVKLSINTFGDYVVRHAQSFIASADAANQ